MTTRAFTPGVDGERWPGNGHYTNVAIIPLDVDAMRQRLGVEPLYDVESGLGPWFGFGGSLDDGTAIELVFYVHAPEPAGFDLRVQSGVDPADALDRVLRIVELERAALPWICEQARR